jgi:VanZ family protein
MRATMPPLQQILHAPRLRSGWRVLLALLVAIVAVAALAPAVDAPTLGVGDKLDHLLAFVTLGLVATLSGPATRIHAAAAGTGVVAYGALIELLQTQVPGRHGDGTDLAVDAVGAVLGLALAHRLRRHWPAPGP